MWSLNGGGLRLKLMVKTTVGHNKVVFEYRWPLYTTGHKSRCHCIKIKGYCENESEYNSSVTLDYQMPQIDGHQ